MRRAGDRATRWFVQPDRSGATARRLLLHRRRRRVDNRRGACQCAASDAIQKTGVAKSPGSSLTVAVLSRFGARIATAEKA